MNKSFSEFQFFPQLTENINNLGYKECTPIQADAMPLILQGQDVAGLAQTGTGKTAAYLIPILHRILSGDMKDWKARQFVLVLVPTRELAEQVLETFQKLSVGTGLRGTAVYGGVGYDKQKEAFAEGHEFIIATPGRLIDLYKEHVADLKQVRAVVFDEADRLFDMGFKDDIRFVLSRIPRERQMLVFSATLNLDVINTCYEFGSHPVELNLSRDKATAENVHHVVIHVGQEEKPMYTLSLIRAHAARQVIVFTNYKNQVERIADFLTKNKLPAMAISSLMTQAQRNKVIQNFKDANDLNILVGTDLAARGLDIKGVDLVINFDLPQDCETYVHRIGRTGRAGETGKAMSLVSDKDVDSLMRVEEFLKQKVETSYLEDAQLIKDFVPYVSEYEERRNNNRNGAGSDNRGPRQSGGPRRDNRSGGGGNRQGPGGRNNNNRPDNRGPRRDGDRPQHANGPRPEGGATAPREGQPRDGQRGPRDGNRPQQPRNNQGGSPNRNRDQRAQGAGNSQGQNGSRPNRPQHKPHQNARPRPQQPRPKAQPPTLAGKVVGFFKGLFR